jgi:hypothetical protein
MTETALTLVDTYDLVPGWGVHPAPCPGADRRRRSRGITLTLPLGVPSTELKGANG